MWLIVLAGFFVIWRLLPHTLLFHRTLFASVLAALAAAHWAYYLIGGLLANRMAARSAAGIGHVVTDGLYARVRHPIYSGDIVLAWGIVLYWPHIWVVIAAVWMTAVLIFWMRLEERALEERFGGEYARYKARTPMVVPRILNRR